MAPWHSTEPLGHLWSEPEAAAVAVNTSGDAFGSLGAGFVVPSCSQGCAGSCQGGQAGSGLQGPKAADWKSSWSL